MTKKVTSKKNKVAKKVKKKSGFYTSKKVVLFSLAFAVVGAALLYHSFANPLPADVNEYDKILISYEKIGSVQVSRSASGKLRYQNMPTQVQLLNTGQLICNNGSNDTVDSSQLSGIEMQSMTDTLKQHLDNIGEDPTGVITDGVSIVLGDGNGNVIKSSTISATAKKPEAFNAAENYLRQQCKRAANRIDVSDLPNTVAPQEKNTFIADITDLFTAKASASSSIYYRANSAGEGQSWTMLQHHRTNYNGEGGLSYGTGLPHPHTLPALRGLTCLTTAAHRHSITQLQAGTTEHGDFAGRITRYCGGGWSTVGENQGQAYNNHKPTQTTVWVGGVIQDALFRSVGHHETNDCTCFTSVGVGAAIKVWDDNGNSKLDDGERFDMFITQEFANYPNK